MVTLYGIKNCDTIKKARRWLEANNIDYRFHDYRVDGLDSELLNDFINELGWEALLNTRGTTWRKLDETTRNKITDAASAAALMTEMAKGSVTHQRLIALLSQEGADFRVVTHEAVGKCEAVSEIRGTALGQGAKALVVMTPTY